VKIVISVTETHFPALLWSPLTEKFNFNSSFGSGVTYEDTAIGKHFSLGIIIGSSAHAADMGLPPSKGPPPPTPPPLTWTGFYIGGNIGGGFGDKQWNNNSSCVECGVAEILGFPGQSLGTTSMDGFLGGFEAGYN